MQDPVVMEVVDGTQKLSHQGFQLPYCEHLLLLPHCLHQALEVVLYVIHNNIDFIHIAAHYNLPHSDYVFMLTLGWDGMR